MLHGLEIALEELLRNYKSPHYKSTVPANTGRGLDSAYSRRRRIHKLEIVRKKTMYGMYTDEFLFVKVQLYDPNDVKRVAAILEVRFIYCNVRCLSYYCDDYDVATV